MCIICLDWQKGNLTSKEAMRNIGEALMVSNKEEKDHLFELSEQILEKELPSSKVDEEIDERWWQESHE